MTTRLRSEGSHSVHAVNTVDFGSVFSICGAHGVTRPTTSFRRAVRAIFAALLLLGLAGNGQAQGNSPLGNWDCVISGARSGLAFLSFSTNGGGTFTGFEIVVPRTVPPARESLIPGMVSGLGDNGLRPSRPINRIITNPTILGSGPLTGSWAFDSQRRVNGSFVEATRGPTPDAIVCTTNQNVTTVQQTTTLTVTNLDGSISTFTTNITVFITNAPIIVCVTNFSPGFTNTTSFVGKVVPGKRLSLVGSTPQGRFVLQGVPSVALADLSGSWLGMRKRDRTSSLELFALTNSRAYFTDAPNIYLVNGVGPDYTYTNGLAILSVQKKIAFAMDLVTGLDFKSTRAVIGPFKSARLKANTAGIESPGGLGSLTNRVTFQVQKRSSVP